MVLPPDEPSVVKLRPVDGSDTDAVGIYTPLEPEAITSSQYPPPDPAQTGDFTGALCSETPCGSAEKYRGTLPIHGDDYQ